MEKIIRVEDQFDGNGKLKYRKFYFDGRLHGIGGPAVERFNEDGNLSGVEYWANGKHLTSIYAKY